MLLRTNSPSSSRREEAYIYLHSGHPSRKQADAFPITLTMFNDELGVVLDTYHERWTAEDEPCDLYWVKLMVGNKIGWAYYHRFTQT